MITTDRRSFLAGTAGLAFVAALPRTALSETHDTLKIAIAAETGDLDLLQNISTLSAYTIVFDALIHYGQNGALEPGLATKWNIADDITNKAGGYFRLPRSPITMTKAIAART